MRESFNITQKLGLKTLLILPKTRNLKKNLKFLPIFQIFLKKKKRFLRKSSKPGHGNLVLFTSTVQVERSKLNFNYEDIRTNFLQVLT